MSLFIVVVTAVSGECVLFLILALFIFSYLFNYLLTLTVNQRAISYLSDLPALGKKKRFVNSPTRRHTTIFNTVVIFVHVVSAKVYVL